VLGAGGATVASSSPFMAKETDPLGYIGLGATYEVAGRWQLRVDGRQGLMPGRPGGATRVSEVQLGLITTFELGGGPPASLGARPRPELGAGPTGTPDPDAADGAAGTALADADADGLPDRLDRCPGEPETVNGIADGDGCPEPDPDGDGLVGTADACPMEAEDFDRFEDTDGCPERDNDHDGVEDVRDVCPGEPETRNGFADTDGCPDVLPESVMRVIANAGAVRFERGRARITPAARRGLAPLLAALEANPDMAIAITGTPEQADGEDLAKRRAEAVKWYLVDQGIAEDRIDTVVDIAGIDGVPPIAIKLR
jgi:OOP family OmpA-OmpF porin